MESMPAPKQAAENPAPAEAAGPPAEQPPVVPAGATARVWTREDKEVARRNAHANYSRRGGQG